MENIPERRKYFEIVENISKIDTLLELKWVINIHGADIVSEILKVNKEKLQNIRKLEIEDYNLSIKNFLNNENQNEEIQNFHKKHKKIVIKNYYNNYYDTKSKSHTKAIRKNENLIDNLAVARDNFLGIGTNKIKRRLNKLAEYDDVAKIVRIALEIEDKNICAKKYFGEYRDKIYNQKSDLIYDLIDLFDKNNFVYGIHDYESLETHHIIFFEIPNCEQISGHSTFDVVLPKYGKEWDGKINSTLNKLADKIKKDYNNIVY